MDFIHTEIDKSTAFAQFKEVCLQAEQIMQAQSNLLKLSGPIVVVGDLRGHLRDLKQIFSELGSPPQTSYLILGNYLGENEQGVQLITLLLKAKVKYPGKVHLLRGKYQSIHFIAKNSYVQIKRKYNQSECLQLLVKTVRTMPLAALINGSIFCVHGGLCYSIQQLQQINKIQRIVQTPVQGSLTNLLWTTPGEREGWDMIPQSYYVMYGPTVFAQFCKKNNINLMLRAGTLSQTGLIYNFDNRLVTIFSASKFLNYGNEGGVVEVQQSGDVKYMSFSSESAEREERRRPDYFECN